MFSVWNIETLTGYTPKTTFWMDFSIADNFGKSAIIDTYKRAFNEWKNDVVYLTELVMVLNWKIAEHYGKNDSLAALYEHLWEQTDVYAVENLTGKDLKYFYDTTD